MSVIVLNRCQTRLTPSALQTVALAVAILTPSTITAVRHHSLWWLPGCVSSKVDHIIQELYSCCPSLCSDEIFVLFHWQALLTGP